MGRLGRDSRPPIPHGILSPLGPRSFLEPVFKLRETLLQGRALQKQNWRCRRREREGGREGDQPSFQCLVFDAWAAETAPPPETRGQTDKHRWKERLSCFIYGLVTGPLLSLRVTNLPGGRDILPPCHPLPSCLRLGLRQAPGLPSVGL